MASSVQFRGLVNAFGNLSTRMVSEARARSMIGSLSRLSVCTRQMPRSFSSGNPVNPPPKSENIVWSDSLLTTEDRIRLTGCKGATVWFTGLSGSGKSTIGALVEQKLIKRGHLAYRMDGDNLRHGLNRDLGFSAADRTENIRRIAEVAKLFSDAGILTLTSFISPYRRDRDAARAIFNSAGLTFIEVPLNVAEKRDPKGLYKKARSGKLKGFTGIDDPYEEPTKPELLLETDKATAEECAEQVVRLLEKSGHIPPART